MHGARDPRRLFNPRPPRSAKRSNVSAGYANKEALVEQRRLRYGITQMASSAFSTLENCTSYDIYRNPKTHTSTYGDGRASTPHY